MQVSLTADQQVELNQAGVNQALDQLTVAANQIQVHQVESINQQSYQLPAYDSSLDDQTVMDVLTLTGSLSSVDGDISVGNIRVNGSTPNAGTDASSINSDNGSVQFLGFINGDTDLSFKESLQVNAGATATFVGGIDRNTINVTTNAAAGITFNSEIAVGSYTADVIELADGAKLIAQGNDNIELNGNVLLLTGATAEITSNGGSGDIIILVV